MAINYGSGRTTATISTNTTLAAGVYEYQNITVNAGISLTVPNNTIIFVKGTLALNGIIEVSNAGTGGGGGLVSSTPSWGQGGNGGDAGGTITVIANTITGSGTIRARGAGGGAGIASNISYGSDVAANSYKMPGTGIPHLTPFSMGISKLPVSPPGGNVIGPYSGGVAFQYGIATKLNDLWDYLQNNVIYQLKQGGYASLSLQAGGGSGGSSGAYAGTYTGAGGPGGAGGTMFGIGGGGGQGDSYHQNSGAGLYEGTAGAGGGGAGGAILLVCPSVSSTLNLDVTGGAGGNAPAQYAGGSANNPRGGGGGGGGGGLILSFTDKDLYNTSLVTGGAAGLKSPNTGTGTSGAVYATDGTIGTSGQYLYLPISTYLS
ncbi:hypothetical protein EV294_10775 [Paenibacillus sp. BK033]|uniref:hypothetical protein n=1 Tax=Paenibacillus sp. BK033 TaxID=2512133 RepID=UPI001053A82B|nr:hypothetical protein [Paenibacillus sp. BK033]TCM93124.1 hypothetical protein EV294_10775 [Paenibacillus sp. BK033]